MANFKPAVLTIAVHGLKTNKLSYKMGLQSLVGILTKCLQKG